jgi:hypothetical protein
MQTLKKRGSKIEDGEAVVLGIGNHDEEVQLFDIMVA